MKRILFYSTVLAGLFMAGSCQRENLEPEQVGAHVTITVEAPGAISTRTIADGKNVNEVHYAVYKTNSGEDYAIDDSGNIDGPLAQGSVPMTDKVASVNFDLLQDQYYTVIFWAQVKDKGHYTLGDLRIIEVAPTADGNDESRAAFYAKYEFNTVEVKDHKVTLVRPFAQLNLLTTEESLTPSQPGQTQGYTVDIKKSQVTVKGLSNSFSTVSGQSPVGTAEFTFTLNDTPEEQGQTTLQVNGRDYHYVSMNYFFVPMDENLVDIDYSLDTDKGLIENYVVSVPVKKNFRTNVIGNLLTKETVFDIVVDERFDIPEIVIGEDWNSIGNFTYNVNLNASQASLKQIFEHADAAAREAVTRATGPEVTINLNGDVYWETGASHGSTPFLPADSPISAVVINGNSKSLIATGKGVGPLRLANGAKVTFNNLNIIDESVSYAESSWEFTYLEFAGLLEFKGCTFNSGVQFLTQGEEAALHATFTDCDFITNENDVYAVWVSDGTTVFEGCTFKGTRGLKMHEDYGSEVISVEVEDCVFGPLSKKPGVAIGNLNSGTEVSIMNSIFAGCQPGDQNNYIYESDTDVTAFTFTCEENSVYADTDKMLECTLKDAVSGETVTIPNGEYKFPTSSFKEGVTLECEEGTVFTGVSTLNISGAAVKGATFSNPTGNAVQSTVDGTFENCTFEGANAFRWCYTGEDVIFVNCLFNGQDRAIHFDTVTKDVTMNNCEFNGTLGFGAGEGLVTLDGCTINKSLDGKFNIPNFYGYFLVKNTDFVFDGTAIKETVRIWNATEDASKSVFENCTVCGEPLKDNLHILYEKLSAGQKVTIDSVVYEYDGSALIAE